MSENLQGFLPNMFSVNKFITNFIVFCYTDSKLERGRNRYQISNHTTEIQMFVEYILYSLCENSKIYCIYPNAIT